MEDRSRAQFKEFCVIYFEEISEAIINQIDQEITQDSAPITLMCLKVLRMIIERENKHLDVIDNHTPCYEWEPEQYEYYKEEIIER